MQLLLEKIQHNDDQQAFRELYQLFFFKLFQFAYSYLGSKENAEEVINDVFLSLWQKRDTLNEINKIHVYLYVAVKNASLNCLRNNKRKSTLSIEDLVTHHLHLKSNPESIMMTRELSSRIFESIEQLPPRCKIVFKLIKEDGLSYKEVASLLEISTKTVDTHLCLSLKKLTEALLPVVAENASIQKKYLQKPANKS